MKAKRTLLPHFSNFPIIYRSHIKRAPYTLYIIRCRVFNILSKTEYSIQKYELLIYLLVQRHWFSKKKVKALNILYAASMLLSLNLLHKIYIQLSLYIFFFCSYIINTSYICRMLNKAQILHNSTCSITLHLLFPLSTKLK